LKGLHDFIHPFVAMQVMFNENLPHILASKPVKIGVNRAFNEDFMLNAGGLSQKAKKVRRKR